MCCLALVQPYLIIIIMIIDETISARAQLSTFRGFLPGKLTICQRVYAIYHATLLGANSLLRLLCARIHIHTLINNSRAKTSSRGNKNDRETILSLFICMRYQGTQLQNDVFTCARATKSSELHNIDSYSGGV